MHRYRVLAGLIIAAATMTVTARSALPAVPDSTRGYGFEVGDRFPEIVLPSLEDGTARSVASFRGQKIALHVWASW